MNYIMRVSHVKKGVLIQFVGNLGVLEVKAIKETIG